MPSLTERQRRYMGAALARKRAGKPRKSDPEMPTASLEHFAMKVRKPKPDGRY